MGGPPLRRLAVEGGGGEGGLWALDPVFRLGPRLSIRVNDSEIKIYTAIANQFYRGACLIIGTVDLMPFVVEAPKKGKASHRLILTRKTLEGALSLLKVTATTWQGWT